MWQRIQTVFLGITILSLIASIFLPIYMHVDASGKTHALYALHYTVIENNVRTSQYFPYSVIAVLYIAAATIAFIEIQKFRNRLLQVKLGALNAVFLAVAVGVAVYFASGLLKANQGGNYDYGLWAPFVAVICNWAAIRFIKRDEKIVRDSDRLR
jgi:CDP-diglyceride synthetase